MGYWEIAEFFCGVEAVEPREGKSPGASGEDLWERETKFLLSWYSSDEPIAIYVKVARLRVEVAMMRAEVEAMNRMKALKTKMQKEECFVGVSFQHGPRLGLVQGSDPVRQGSGEPWLWHVS